MAASAVSQNLNDLDNLLHDLSNAKFSDRILANGSVRSDLADGSNDDPFVRAECRTVETRQEMREETIFVESKTIEQGSRWEYAGSIDLKSLPKTNGVANGNGSIFKRPDAAASRQLSTVSTLSKRSEFSFAASSTSSHELDDLMTSLNSFRLRDGGLPATEIPVNTTLDVMLTNLTETLEKEGVRATPKGICFECDKTIVGQVVTAMGHIFHPEHFVCAHCNQELSSRNFFEREGKPYCEDDFQRLFSPRCAACNGAILDRCITALDATWHPDHFVCAECDRPFGDEGFHEREGRAFCNRCYHAAFAPKCGGCQLPITENYLTCMEQQWHAGCFVCTTCRQPFSNGNYFEHDGLPYCEKHFHLLRGPMCAGCGQMVTGRCITAMFRKFHPEHFVCSFCLKQLNKGTFKESSEKPFCHECFERLFG